MLRFSERERRLSGILASVWILGLVFANCGGPSNTGNKAFLYVGGAISPFALDETSGTLTPLEGTSDQAGFPASDPMGRFLFIGSDNGVTVERVNGLTGALTMVPGSPFGGPFGQGEGGGALAVDAHGRFVCVLRGSVELGLASVLEIDPSSGALSPTSGSPFPVGRQPRAIAVHSSGFVYVLNTTFDGQDSVSAFQLDSAGGLGPIAESPFPTGSGPQAIALDPSGKFVYVATGSAGSLSNGVWAYRIDPKTGGLTLVPGSPFVPSFLTAFGVAVDPSGRFVVVTSFDAAAHEPLALLPKGFAQVLRLDPGTGVLTPAGSPVSVDSPTYVAFDPSGRFLLMSDQAVVATPVVGGVSAFSLDPSAGSLTLVTGSPFVAQGGGGSLVTIAPRSTP